MMQHGRGYLNQDINSFQTIPSLPTVVSTSVPLGSGQVVWLPPVCTVHPSCSTAKQKLAKTRRKINQPAPTRKICGHVTLSLDLLASTSTVLALYLSCPQHRHWTLYVRLRCRSLHDVGKKLTTILLSTQQQKDHVTGAEWRSECR